jgi:hypothetical protein
VFDFNDDGDKDVIIASYNFASLLERSFIEHGCAKAEAIGRGSIPVSSAQTSSASKKPN